MGDLFLLPNYLSVIYLNQYERMDISALDVGQAVLHSPFFAQIAPSAFLFLVTLTYPLCIFLKCFFTLWQAPAHLVYFLLQL